MGGYAGASPIEGWRPVPDSFFAGSGFRLAPIPLNTTPSTNTPTDTPIATFSDFGLADPILRAVSELGYKEPTPIQVQR